ncbi:MAG: nicotinate phosphoribosyltransferase [Acidobacteriaceae bacterium]|nr:nicotinate phosphoribosyltransferase [Acidobacteriaceae bacterium]
MLSDCKFSGLLTDLYELTMAAGYVQSGFEARATFELLVRSLPERRNYLVAAGLEQALEFLENMRFSEEEISYVRALPVFSNVSSKFFDYLSDFHFTGDVWALPEGTIYFPGEPVLRVTAPIVEAQIVETTLLSILHFQSVIASKAARIKDAAGGRQVIEFGSRRAHGIEAGVLAARAAYIGGCEGTSNTYAGHRFKIPVYGTQAHSWIMAHKDEAEAFRIFLDVFPQATLLVDTYNVRAAVEKIIAQGRKPHGIRLDSGNVLEDSAWLRNRLDRVGWNDVEIFVSGDLDEERISSLLNSGARIDGFGVGTALSTSSDAPALSVIYKLVEVEVGGRVHNTAKISEDKHTYPGSKQVFRFSHTDGMFSHDIVGLDNEVYRDAQPLLAQVMQQGQRIASTEEFLGAHAGRKRFLTNRERLSKAIRGSGRANPFPVQYSRKLEDLFVKFRENLASSRA